MKKVFPRTVGLLLNGLSLFSSKYAAKKAMFLFTTPSKGRINEDQAEFLESAHKEELIYNNLPIMTYHWIGENKTILLVHGWESNAARWRKLIMSLQKQDYNIVALDAPAHGNSGSKTFNAVLYSEFINVVVKRFNPHFIIGHSVGGMATVYCQHKYQIENIQKLVLLGVPSEFSDVLKRYTDMLGYNQRIIKELHTTIIERFGDRPETFSTAKWLKEITSEGLIIHDEDDTVIPYKDAVLIKNGFKNSKLITTKGLSHSLNNNTIVNLIYDFIDG